jgi:ubiquinone/menaquinone biosynthesis C-methylase UbiE
MDYRDYIDGQTGEQFWFRSKKDLINILMNKIGRKNLKILNIGAGTGVDLEIMNRFGNIYIIDVNKKALDLIPSNLYSEKKLCDATDLPYPNDFFDIVCSFDVFEHIKNDKKAVLEAHRVLKKGGLLLLMVPAFNFLFSAHDRALLHYRRYSKKKLYELLRIFKNEYLSYWNSILFIPLSILRILKKRAKPKTDYFNLPSLLEKAFLNFLRIENKLIMKDYRLPFGLSLVGVYRK